METAEQLAPKCQSHFSGDDRPTWELYSTCIHCGLCLNHCPTYRVLGTEMDSPRGRIYQILQVDAGRLPLADTFVTHIDRCLGCLACETACPSGVQYGRIVERARAQIEQHYRRPLLAQIAKWFFYKTVLTRPRVLSHLATLVRFYQRSGLQTFARRGGLLRLLGTNDIDRLSPEIDSQFFFSEIGKVVPAEGQRRVKVAFHAGCVANVAFSALNHATVRLLAKNGVEVHIVSGQRCCGALQAHAGLREEARELARINIDALSSAPDVDAIITNSAGCGSHMKEYSDLLDNERAISYSRKTRDVTEFLAEIGLLPPKVTQEMRVTYQDPCHLAHAQRICSAPRDLLRQAGVEIVEMRHADQCCGSAGSYNVTEHELSMRILEAKMEDVKQVAPMIEAVVTANTGCILQLRAGLDKSGINLPVKHIVEILNDCY